MDINDIPALISGVLLVITICNSSRVHENIRLE
jgi:hypothetical protein